MKLSKCRCQDGNSKGQLIVGNGIKKCLSCGEKIKFVKKEAKS